MICELPTDASRPNHWPTTLVNPTDPHYSLVIQSVTPIADEYQIREQRVGFNGLMHAVCSDGRRTISARLPHSLSLYAVTCPDAGLSIPNQQAILAATLRSIIFGQIIYGNAAIDGHVQDPSGTKIGDVISVVLPAPPIIRRDWPSRVLHVPVPDSQGLRLRVESMGPAVDNWDRFWFLGLCEEGKAQFLREVNLQVFPDGISHSG